MRTIKRFPLPDLQLIKPKLLSWAQQYEEIIWLDGNDYPLKEKVYRAVLAIDAFTAIRTDEYKGFDKLQEYTTNMPDWLFGYLTYDLKNDVEDLQSQNIDGLHFPGLYFFQPKKVFLFFEDYVELQYLNLVADEMDEDWDSILKMDCSLNINQQNQIEIQSRNSKEEYLKKVNQVLDHIKKGDIYEVNLCQEFYSEASTFDLISTYFHLNQISKAPFSAFVRLNEFFVLSASPERYIKKTGNRVVSQPIKGTSKRSANLEEDIKLAKNLINDPKERSENIMITDLVRNDLSRFAEKGSVIVEELCGIYTFEQVHQLISTISCTVSTTIDKVDILRKTFPMGSMTGAPKVSAMKIIENIEDSKRGLYSGSIGYFSPNGDFDFNVVIRSILYNSLKKYVSFSVGGAITINSNPEMEYEECMVKAKAMRQVLECN